MFRETFKQMLRTWQFAGIEEIVLEFLEPFGSIPLYDTKFIATVEGYLSADRYDDAEGYMAVVLKRAYIENVGQYTLDGK